MIEICKSQPFSLCRYTHTVTHLINESPIRKFGHQFSLKMCGTLNRTILDKLAILDDCYFAIFRQSCLLSHALLMNLCIMTLVSLRYCQGRIERPIYEIQIPGLPLVEEQLKLFIIHLNYIETQGPSQIKRTSWLPTKNSILDASRKQKVQK